MFNKELPLFYVLSIGVPLAICLGQHKVLYGNKDFEPKLIWPFIQEGGSQHRSIHLLFNILFHLQNLRADLLQSRPQISAPALLIWLTLACFLLMWLMLKLAISSTPCEANLKITTFLDYTGTHVQQSLRAFKGGERRYFHSQKATGALFQHWKVNHI